MPILRHFLKDHSPWVLALLALALLVRAAVPSGFMISSAGDGWPTVILCPTTAPAAMTQSLDHAAMGHANADMGSMMGVGQAAHHGAHDGTNEQGSKPMHCAFSSLTHAAIGGADAALLALAIAYILLLATRQAVPPVVSRISFLRPPLRAPPPA